MGCRHAGPTTHLQHTARIRLRGLFPRALLNSRDGGLVRCSPAAANTPFSRFVLGGVSVGALNVFSGPLLATPLFAALATFPSPALFERNDAARALTPVVASGYGAAIFVRAKGPHRRLPTMYTLSHFPPLSMRAEDIRFHS